MPPGSKSWPSVALPLVALAMTQLLACHRGSGAITDLPADGQELAIIDQKQGTHSHETRAMNLVIRSPAAWAQIPLADIDVDFSREMLLVVTLGSVTSDRYAVRIDRVWREGRQLRVEVAVQHPERGAPTVVASPYCIAVVPRCDLNVAGFLPEPPPRERSWQQSRPPAGL